MKLKEIWLFAKNKNLREIQKFMKDMRKAELKMQYYRGRYFWHGPAVICGSIQEVLSNTKVKCQWDNMGKGYVVYPVQGLGLYDIKIQITLKINVNNFCMSKNDTIEFFNNGFRRINNVKNIKNDYYPNFGPYSLLNEIALKVIKGLGNKEMKKMFHVQIVN